MFRRFFLILFLFTGNYFVNSESSADYLQSAIWNLENRINGIQSKRRIDTLQMKSSEKDNSQNVPMLSLTKGELAALYEATLTKDRHVITPKPDDQEGAYIHAVVHELNDGLSSPYTEKHKSHDQSSGDTSGYYYYYYPIDSFIDGFSSTSHPHIPHDHHHTTEPEKLHAQYHSHTHQHNVHITSTKSMPENNKKKIMEPLFMAVSSFIGMAVMFVLSILFLPKFGGPKSRGVKQTQGYEEMTTLAQVILKAIEGDDCSERIVCELGKTAKAFNMYDNRFVKLFRRMSPESIGWYVDGIKKYAQTNLTCSTIQCRRKIATKSKSNKKL